MINEHIKKFLGSIVPGFHEIKDIKDLPNGSRIFVPFEAFHIILEQSQDPQGPPEFILFLDLSYKKYSNTKGNFYAVEVHKKSDEEYILIPPMSINDMNKAMVQGSKINLSMEYLSFIFSNIPKNNIVKLEQNPFGTPDVKNKNQQIFERYLSNNYMNIAGRELTTEEKNMKILSVGKFVPKKSDNVDPKKIFKIFQENLVLQDHVKRTLFSNLNIHDILVGKLPTNSGIVLYGPGGTGKTTIMKVVMKVFEDYLGAYVPKNEQNEVLKTSEVGDTKYVGAYQDYFGPIFAESIREARRRGIPSLICIDEGDIFVENPENNKNPHASDLINFFKAYVGNHKEFIVVLSTNVLKENLNPIAVRRGRISTVEIPLPDFDIAKNLLYMNIKRYEVKLDRDFKEAELKDIIGKFVELNRPGADLDDFFKNFFTSGIDVTKEYESGKTSEEIEEMIRAEREKVISVEEFIERFKEDVLGENVRSSHQNSSSSNHTNETNNNNHEQKQDETSEKSLNEEMEFMKLWNDPLVKRIKDAKTIEEILDLKLNARYTFKEIQNMCSSIMRMYHPDRFKFKKAQILAHEVFVKVQDAFDCYDKKRSFDWQSHFKQYK